MAFPEAVLSEALAVCRIPRNFLWRAQGTLDGRFQARRFAPRKNKHHRIIFLLLCFGCLVVTTKVGRTWQTTPHHRKNRTVLRTTPPHTVHYKMPHNQHPSTRCRGPPGPGSGAGSGTGALPGQGNHLLNRRTRGVGGGGPLDEEGEFDFQAGLAKFDKEKVGVWVCRRVGWYADLELGWGWDWVELCAGGWFEKDALGKRDEQRVRGED